MIKSEIPANRLLSAVHGLRGLAAMSVVLFHLHHLTQLALPSSIGFIATHFGLGVQLFFVLSAFSLCYSTTDSIGKDNWVKIYLIKRYFRIAPSFYLMLIVWETIFLVRHVAFDPGNMLINILMIYNFVPGKHESIVAAGWTIGVEVIFYILLPVLLMTIKNTRQALIFAVFALTLGASVRNMLQSGPDLLRDYAHASFPVSLGVFALGILSYQLFKSGQQLDHAKCKQFCLRLMIGLAALLVVLASSLGGQLASVPWAPNISLWSLWFALLVVWQATQPSRVLSSVPMEYVGERSFGIYLIHPLVIFAITPLNLKVYALAFPFIQEWAFVPCAALTLSICIAGSILIYKLVETPGIRFSRNLVKKLS